MIINAICLFMKETASDCSISATRTDASNGHGRAKKPDRFPISSSAGCWKV